jgi:hypothetical protein
MSGFFLPFSGHRHSIFGQWEYGRFPLGRAIRSNPFRRSSGTGFPLLSLTRVFTSIRRKLNRPVLEGHWNNREVDSIGV